MLSRLSVFMQEGKIGLHGSAIRLLHVARYTFFDTSPYLAVTLPGKTELTKKLTKLLIVHKITTSRKKQKNDGLIITNAHANLNCCARGGRIDREGGTIGLDAESYS